MKISNKKLLYSTKIMYDSDISKRISQLIDVSSGGNASEFARKIGVTPQYIGVLANGNKRPGREIVERISSSTGVNPTWLMTGQGTMFASEGTPLDLAQVMNTANSLMMSGQTVSNELRVQIGELFLQEFIMLPRYNIQASGGHGELNEIGEEQVLDVLVFKREWVTRFNRDINNLLLVTLVGDSMEPTIYNRDVLLIDRSKNRINRDAIYVLRQGNALRVKRLQWRADGILEIRSDNVSKYDVERISNEQIQEIQIIGQVIWIGRDL